MKNKLLPIMAFALIVLIFTGCGGGASSSTQDKGYLTVSVGYPQDKGSSSSDYVAYYLIDVFEKDADTNEWKKVVSTTRIDYPQTKATISNIPIGDKLITVKGLNESNVLVRYGEKMVNIKAGDNPAVEITVTPTSTPSPSPSPVLVGYKFVSEWCGSPSFQKPIGIAKGSVYVTDNISCYVQVFDLEGNHITTWGGSSEFSDPTGIVVDHDGYIYVADTSPGVVKKYDSSYNCMSQIPVPYEPRDVAVDTDNYIYIALRNNTASSVPGVVKYTPAGNYDAEWGYYGSDEGDLNKPEGIDVSPDNCIYVADTGNSRIQVFDKYGNFLFKWGRFGTQDGEFKHPTSIAVGPMGNVYVADTGNHRIQVFNKDGNFITKFGSYGTEQGKFDTPSGIAVDENQNLYIADTNNRRVQKFAPIYR